jgi:hypothetical protein
MPGKYSMQRLASLILLVALVLCGCESRLNPFANHELFLGYRTSAGIKKFTDRKVLFDSFTLIDSLAKSYDLHVISQSFDPRYPDNNEYASWSIGEGEHDDWIEVDVHRGSEGMKVVPGSGRSLNEKTKGFLEELIKRLRLQSQRSDLVWGDKYYTLLI